MSKAILITGCSTGIGYTCAHALHQQGYQVIASCRNQDDVVKLQQEGLNLHPVRLKFALTASVLARQRPYACVMEIFMHCLIMVLMDSQER